ncbi:TPA: hypothetical protein QDB48_000974 [Burkholderia vietnamiensis]|nr:hypothetical protein [Burkholderia vietnamiensis]
MSFAQIEGGVIVAVMDAVDPVANADHVVVDISGAQPAPLVGWFASLSDAGVWQFSESLVV